MKRLARNFAIIAAAAALVPAGARAQWYSSYPRQAAAYPYGAQPQQHYAVEVAPGTYVIRHPKAERQRAARAERAAPERTRARVHNDPALIGELRKHSRIKRSHVKHARAERKIDRTVERTVKRKVKVVREKPVVVVHKRYVDDPPRVIVRQRVIDDLPRGRGLFSPPPQQIVRDLPPVQVSPAPVPLPPSWHRESRRVERHHKLRHAEHRKIEHYKAARHVEGRKVVVVRSELGGKLGDKRTIHAEAEVTIRGPDRMTIRLYRKGGAKARVD
jgi:hypothetical protein